MRSGVTRYVIACAMPDELSSSSDADGPEIQSGPFAEEVPEDTACPACGVEIERPDERKQHLDGLDSSRPECPHQDLEAIAQRERNRPWTRAINARTAW